VPPPKKVQPMGSSPAIQKNIRAAGRSTRDTILLKMHDSRNLQPAKQVAQNRICIIVTAEEMRA